MPFRFRKIIPFSKGFHINLSKGGISSSIGGKGFHLNLGRSGIRPTMGMPGTGLSYTQYPTIELTIHSAVVSNALMAIHHCCSREPGE